MSKTNSNILFFSVLFLGLFAASTSSAQDIFQTVRGQVVDADSELPLIGAVVYLEKSDPIIGATTDVDGNFRLERIPLGRISLQVSYIGYKPLRIPNIVVNSAKEVVLNLRMEESLIQMEELLITASGEKGEALDDMALVSARSVSTEESNRYAGGFSDPSRILSNFAGVSTTRDGGNEVIVRGNSPKYMQWRLEGVQISNPNHFADQSSVGGSISTLNNNLLSTSDFYTGAFSPEFGDVLSGVYDLRLRSGNNEKFESIIGFGFLGTDLTLEGPLSIGNGASFLANYRYSTVTVISDLGLVDVGGIPKFQDAAFKIQVPTKKHGNFSLFGLGGKSSFLFEDVTPSLWDTPGDNSLRPEIREDYNKDAFLVNIGLNHTYSLSPSSFLRSNLSYSTEGLEDQIFELEIADREEGATAESDSVLSTIENYRSRVRKKSYRASFTYHKKLGVNNRIQAGSKYGFVSLTNAQSQLDEGLVRQNLVDFDEGLTTIRNFFSWRSQLTKDLSMVAGLHNNNVFLSGESTIEPRVALNWDLASTFSVQAAYGKHSTLESPHHYFAQVPAADGSVLEPNKDLSLLKAHHFLLGAEKRLSTNVRFKVEAYYQDLYDLAVSSDPSSHYSTINESLDFEFLDLVSEGTGANYGIEFTLEKFHSSNYYYLINASLYQSKYESLEGIERNTRFNGNYLVNVLAGKEFVKFGRGKNQSLGVNLKMFYSGGPKVIPLLRDGAGNVISDPSNNTIWDFGKAYDDKIEDLYEITVALSYKWNRPKTTHEIYLSLENVTHTKGKISEFYDAREPNSTGYLTQFGFFPNLLYRFYF